MCTIKIAIGIKRGGEEMATNDTHAHKHVGSRTYHSCCTAAAVKAWALTEGVTKTDTESGSQGH